MTVPGLELETEYTGPKRGADRAVLLAHGAGADMHAAALTVVADALATAKIPCLRFQYPYRSAGKKAPDRPAVLAAATRAAVEELAKRSKLSPSRLVLGGRSMGGRMCSMAVAEGLAARALVLVSYPLHPPGRPDQLRTAHLPQLDVPVLFVQGTSDPFGSADELRAAAATIAGPVTFEWIEGGRHDLKGADTRVASVVAGFLRSLR